MNHTCAQTTSRCGFSIVELAVVFVIISVLAAFGVPGLLTNVERSKANEAFQYFSSVQAAQERHQSLNGTYATDLTDLDIALPTPKYFVVGNVVAGTTGDVQDSWSLTLTRTGSASGYGQYTVVYSNQGYDITSSTIVSEIDPTAG